MEIFKGIANDGKVCEIQDDKFEMVVSELRSGHLIVYPTETIYGLGADPFDELAVKRVFKAKKRPYDMPLSIAVSNSRMLEELAFVDDRARRLIEHFHARASDAAIAEEARSSGHGVRRFPGGRYQDPGPPVRIETDRRVRSHHLDQRQPSLAGRTLSPARARSRTWANRSPSMSIAGPARSASHPPSFSFSKATSRS